MAVIPFNVKELDIIDSQEKFVNGNIAVSIGSLASDDYFAMLKAVRAQGSQNNHFLDKINTCRAINDLNLSTADFIGSTFLDIESHKQEILALLEVLGYGDIVNNGNITKIVKTNYDTILESTGFACITCSSNSVEDGGLRAYEFSNEFGSYLLSFNDEHTAVCVYYDNGGSYSPAFAFTAVENE